MLAESGAADAAAPAGPALTPERLGDWLDRECRGVPLPADPVGDFVAAERGKWRDQRTVVPRTVYYFYRLGDDVTITAVCFANASDDAGIGVETAAPDGTLQPWAKRSEGDLLVFYPPDGYAGGGFGVTCRWPLKPLPRERLEAEALRNRHSGRRLMSNAGG